MRVAIIHDDLVQWGGAERVLLGLSEIYPDAPIYTSLYDKNNPTLKRFFGSKKIITSFLQKVPGWKILPRSGKLALYKALLPFYPLAFEQFDLSEFDLVISHTTRFAKSIITKPETKHICYCHTPPRFLWHFSGTKSYGLGEMLMTKLRLYDAVAARRVDHFIAGSENAKKRIKKIYRMDARVVYPFVDLERFKSIEGFDGGYFLVIGRPNEYKKIDLVKRTCQKLGLKLRIVSGGLNDEMVVQILAGCKALIIAGIEDFGLTSLEAQAVGKPVIAFKAGGVLETVIEDKTGIFFDEQTEDSLGSALSKLDSIRIDPDNCKANAAKFSKENFVKIFQAAVDSL